MLVLAEEFSFDRTPTSFDVLWDYNLVTLTSLHTRAAGTFEGYSFGNDNEVGEREIYRPISVQDQISCGFYCRVNNSGSVVVTLQGDEIFSIKIEAFGQFQIKITTYDNGVENGVYLNELLDQWVHVELNINNLTMKAFVNGFESITTSVATDADTYDVFKIKCVTKISGGRALIDNVVVSDGGVIGPVQVQKFLPNQDIWKNEWAQSIMGGDHYTLVDDINVETVGFLSTNTDTNREQYYFNSVTSNDTIHSIALEAVIKSASSESLSAMRQGVVNQLKTKVISNTEYRSILFDAQLDPLNSLEWLSDSVKLAFGLEKGDFISKSLILDLQNGHADLEEDGIPVSTLGFIENTDYFLDVSILGNIEMRVN